MNTIPIQFETNIVSFLFPSALEVVKTKPYIADIPKVLRL